jgi:hypothetical protein
VSAPTGLLSEVSLWKANTASKTGKMQPVFLGKVAKTTRHTAEPKSGIACKSRVLLFGKYA